MSFMFANTRSNQSNSSYLVEFKAGRSNLLPGSTPEKRKIVADKAKGVIFIKQSADQLMHFCWKNRDTGTVIDDLIIFPGDTEFIPVKECSDGRVYMLKFKSTDERRIFWMQDAKTEKDEENCKKVNDILNNPPAQRSSARSNVERSAGGSFGVMSSLSNANASDINSIGSLDQNQLMQFFSLVNRQTRSGQSASTTEQPTVSHGSHVAGEDTATTQVTTPSNTPANGSNIEGTPSKQVELGQLKEIFANLREPRHSRNVNLSSMFSDKAVDEIVKKNADRLIPHLPQQEYNDPISELEDTVRAPQFREAAETFGTALQTGQLGPVLQQFGMSAEVVNAAHSGSFKDFAQKLTQQEGGDKKEEITASMSTTLQQPMETQDVNMEIAREADEQETTESVVSEKEKKEKTNDQMETD